MLEPHQRAQRMANAAGQTWQHFVRSRFIGEIVERNRSSCLGVVIQTATQQSDIHAELGGLLEYSADQSLPVVHEFVATIDLLTRQLSIEGSNGANYAGAFSENGRVLNLQPQLPGNKAAKPLHLIHEGTLAELLSDDG